MSTVIQNKKASFNYEIVEKFDAGIELFGFEVKSLRNGKGSLDGAHVTVRGGEAYLIGAHVTPYQINNTPPSYDPDRNRRLLLTKEEIGKLAGLESKKGLTIVPISVYNAGRKLKIAIAIARGKKKFDKRETLKKRESDREIQRTLKRE